MPNASTLDPTVREAARKLQARKRVWVDLSDPEFDPVYAFAAAHYPGLAIGHTVRELLLMAIGSNPMDSAIAAARRAAFILASKQVRYLLADALRNAAAVLRQDAATAEAMAVAEGIEHP